MERHDRKCCILRLLRDTMPSRRCASDKDGAPRCPELFRGQSDPLTGVMFGLSSDIPACHPSVTHTKQRGGLNFWEQAGDRAASPTSSHTAWQLPMIKELVARPKQSLILHVDRGTEVIVNGMKGKLSDLRAGDFVSVDIRPGDKLNNLWPYFIRVYRYK